MMNRFFDPLVHKFLDALREALPDCEEEGLMWCYHFLSGALTLTFADTKRIDKLSGSKCKSSDFETAYQKMVPFISGGFKAFCKKNQAKRMGVE